MQPAKIWNIVEKFDELWRDGELKGARGKLTQYRFKDWVELEEKVRVELINKAVNKEITVKEFTDMSNNLRFG